MPTTTTSPEFSPFSFTATPIPFLPTPSSHPAYVGGEVAASTSSSSSSNYLLQQHHPQEDPAAAAAAASSAAAHQPPPPPSTEDTCSNLGQLFDALDHYFREEDILAGSEHSTPLVGFLITFAYAVVITVGTVGNLLTIVAVVRNRQMRTVRNFFILNLALSDFFICTVTAPLTLYTVLYVFWPYGAATCKIVGSLQGFNIFLSTFSIAAIALDRYVLVIFPTKRERQHNLSLLFFSLIWLISILLALPLFAASDLKLLFQNEECAISASICHEQNASWERLPLGKELYTLAVLVIQYALPLASIAFVYSRIARRMGARLVHRRHSAMVPPPVSTSNVYTFASPSKGAAITTAIAVEGLTMVAEEENQAAGLVADPRHPQSGANRPMSEAAAKKPRAGSVPIDQSGKQHHQTSPPKSAGNRAPPTTNNNNTPTFPMSTAAVVEEHERRRKSLAERHRRTNLLLTAIVIIFAIAWLPLNIFHLLNTFNWTGWSYSVPVFALCHVVAICSACLNPLSYAFFNQNFRAEFIAIFRSMGLISLYERLSHFWHLITRKRRYGGAEQGGDVIVCRCRRCLHKVGAPCTQKSQPPDTAALSLPKTKGANNNNNNNNGPAFGGGNAKKERCRRVGQHQQGGGCSSVMTAPLLECNSTNNHDNEQLGDARTATTTTTTTTVGEKVGNPQSACGKIYHCSSSSMSNGTLGACFGGGAAATITTRASAAATAAAGATPTSIIATNTTVPSSSSSSSRCYHHHHHYHNIPSTSSITQNPLVTVDTIVETTTSSTAL